MAFADNWRTVLAVDAGLGFLIAVSGLVLAVARGKPAGFVLAVVGTVYVGFVIRRYFRWQALRLRATRRPPE